MQMTSGEAARLEREDVRAGADQGVLVVAKCAPRLLLDAVSLHQVNHLVRQLRAAGKHRDLLDEVGRPLRDQAVIEQDDFQESLAQMRRGEGTVLHPLPGIDVDEQ